MVRSYRYQARVVVCSVKLTSGGASLWQNSGRDLDALELVLCTNSYILYLTGDWSVDQFGLQPMPFDGFLFASYTKETGGILTVSSELGEPIHKITTLAVNLWREFDESVFK